jgi:hypothetical protein
MIGSTFENYRDQTKIDIPIRSHNAQLAAKLSSGLAQKSKLLFNVEQDML